MSYLIAGISISEIRDLHSMQIMGNGRTCTKILRSASTRYRNAYQTLFCSACLIVRQHASVYIGCAIKLSKTFAPSKGKKLDHIVASNNYSSFNMLNGCFSSSQFQWSHFCNHMTLFICVESVPVLQLQCSLARGVHASVPSGRGKRPAMSIVVSCGSRRSTRSVLCECLIGSI